MADLIARLKEQSAQQLKASSLYQGANAWLAGLSQRDQKTVKGVLVLVALTLVFAWVWQPSYSASIKAEKRLSTELSFHKKMKDNAHLFSSSLNKAPTGVKGSILSVVNNTAKAKNISLKRFEPEGKTGLRIWLDQANFNSVIDWLDILESQKGLTIEQISIDKVSSGLVNLRAVLKS